ncbi:uncharacterized protein LOC132942809 [Metopolophium dirhodum]|uniref:uncharacterized protein LOC132942809 n=1 Tax=Metopolophium dirhodum TaxID=44670 RepID=UPI0029908042|nr:uncharacterized protein LOC132942809 [Metopolophium dirhodum]
MTCTGKVTTNLNEPYELFTKWTDHNHESSDETLKLKNLALTNMKSRSVNSRESTNQILLSVIHENNEDVRNKIGNTDSIRRTIRRARRKNVPEEPRSMQFVLPEKWKTTMGGESKEFLIYDSESENRMLIFATSRALTILSSASLWFMDGTFKCSSVFAQLYVIRAEFEDNVFTCVYAFLPNKLQTTYEEMLTNVILASIRNRSPVKPETIIIDFEIGVINAISLVFNQVKIQGCFFHLCQSVWRQIQNLGLSKMYKDNEQIAKQCKIITSLAFLPVEEIPNEIVNMYLTFTPELFPLIFYFESTYINGKNGAPRFPLEIWNVRHQTIKNSHRTNNFSEGWNSSFNKLVGSANPSFWSVLRSLQLDECSSHLNKNRRQKNQNTQNKIHDACVQHENIT